MVLPYVGVMPMAIHHDSGGVLLVSTRASSSPDASDRPVFTPDDTPRNAPADTSRTTPTAAVRRGWRTRLTRTTAPRARAPAIVATGVVLRTYPTVRAAIAATPRATVASLEERDAAVRARAVARMGHGSVTMSV